MPRNMKISLLLIVAACLSTLLILRKTTSDERPSQAQLNHRPNAFMRDVNYYQYDEGGLLHSHLVSPLITHFPYQNSFQFTRPHYLIYTDKRIPWNITANSGKSQQGIKRIYLWDHVKVHEPPQPTEPETTITTSMLTLFPERSFAKTNDPVTITRPNAVIKATGMTSNLKKGLVHLLSHSRGVYEVEPAPGKKNS
ncbi:LPS export ABC transporter periplasmic protein LptC [Coxiella burnetii]|uniref:LPS export ABC transporter periplasmic protein LptC n=1 Tax=Coxiella burnetii TaxID=777 RepID=UPI0000ED018A|nr:LPS export ABC transporter periplasmic protein LptC [Coxiella burnetii]ACJ20670.1 hypothetical protein CbuK_1507 [Coxiella burnetii CbuK_Q154]EAX32208.1 LPS export ABC transporter periplasmic protein LptC [Coxiella burnetii 'MSU Goat Q177']UYK70365.1 LPS export ABC transporter periplasmic protein LptC [Coxiella burnetii]